MPIDPKVALSKAIEMIGGEVARCDKGCDGICCDRARGLPPRGPILERGDRAGKGCVIVGLNPGSCIGSPAQTNFTLAHERGWDLYNSLIKHWNKDYFYYKRLRLLARELGYTGTIVWTELVKCERAGKQELPVQTLRTCVNEFLLRELSLIPEDWPLIGVGRESFKALAYLFPNRLVVGVPHATGAYGRKFTGMLNQDNTALVPDVLACFQEAHFKNPRGAIFLRAPEPEPTSEYIDEVPING